MFTLSQQGAFAALTAACCWAVATILFKGMTRDIPPLHLNLMKGFIASVFLVTAVVFTGHLSDSLPSSTVALLALSGVIGIALGDSAYFAALARLGARKTLLTESITPPLTAIIALAFLGECLTANAWTGILMTVLGVAWVIAERVPNVQGTEKSSHIEGSTKSGAGFALLAAFCQATGAVLSRKALVSSSIAPIWSALIRLVAAVFCLMVWIFGVRSLSVWDFCQPLNEGKLRRLLVAVFIGTFVAIWLQQVALKLNNAGVAQTMLATSPLFVLPMAPWVGERVTLRAILGALMAILGVAVLFGIWAF